MAKAKDRVSDMKPYVTRALQDEEVRENVRGDRSGARDLRRADRARGRRRPSPRGSRPTRTSRTSLRRGRRPEQGRDSRAGEEGAQLAERDAPLTGIVLGVLFNPVTGPRPASGSRTSCSAGTRADRPVRLVGRQQQKPPRASAQGPLAAARERAAVARARGDPPASAPSARTRLPPASRARASRARGRSRFEMSRDWSRIAPGLGARLESESGGAQPDTA